VDLTGEAAEIGATFGDANRLLASYVHTPLPLAVPTLRNRRLRAARDELFHFVDGLVASRRREGGDRGDLLATLLEARDEESGRRMDDGQVRDEVMTLLVAGHETTASAVGWACYLLARHPEAEARLRTELRAVLGDRLPGLQDLAALPYLRMVLSETMRLYPPAWSFGRRAVVDDEIGGWRIPAGTIVWLCPYVTHRHPAFWDEAETFDPERFRPEAEAARHRFAYFPFAAGPRMCAGRDFALLEASLVLAGIVRRCPLGPMGGTAVEPVTEITLRPPDGLRMVPVVSR
jgi:cytochrome P450